jgi:hypothetical protein
MPAKQVKQEDPSSVESLAGGAGTRALFVQLVMRAQLDGYRVGHDLAAMDLSRLASVNRGVPTRVRVAVNGHPEIAGADPLRDRRLLLLIHAARSLQFSP